MKNAIRIRSIWVMMLLQQQLTLQSSTLFIASSTSSFSRSALAVSACVFVPEIIDLVACNHLRVHSEKQKLQWEWKNSDCGGKWREEWNRPRSGRIVVKHQLSQLFPLLQDVGDVHLQVWTKTNKQTKVWSRVGKNRETLLFTLTGLIQEFIFSLYGLLTH